jgi:hypothetical protein
MEPTAEEFAAAAQAVQSWIRSCFDQAGVCALCGSPNPGAHVNDCPWPQTRALLDRSAVPS